MILTKRKKRGKRKKGTGVAKRDFCFYAPKMNKNAQRGRAAPHQSPKFARIFLHQSYFRHCLAHA